MSTIDEIGRGKYEIHLSSTQPIIEAIGREHVSIDGIDLGFSVRETNDNRSVCNVSIPIADSLLQPPDQQSPHHMLNILCDDVLRMILEAGRFNAKDLTATANVCTRFDQWYCL